MKLKIDQPPRPPQPPTVITLELTEEEAAFFATCVANVYPGATREAFPIIDTNAMHETFKLNNVKSRGAQVHDRMIHRVR